MESLAAMLEAVLRGRGIDAHAADGVANSVVGGVEMLMCMASMVTVPAATGRFLDVGRSLDVGLDVVFGGAPAGGMPLMVRMFVFRFRHANVPGLETYTR